MSRRPAAPGRVAGGYGAIAGAKMDRQSGGSLGIWSYVPISRTCAPNRLLFPDFAAKQMKSAPSAGTVACTMPREWDYGKLVWEAMAVDRATIFKIPRADDLSLAEVVRRLVSAYSPDRIYLFGSVARGDAGVDSDYDLLLVVPDDAPPERRRSRLAYEALRGTGAAADVLVCTRSYFDDRRTLEASLPGTVLREGRLLHAA